MPRLPAVSGIEVVKALTKIGYDVDHQTGSHMILRQSPYRLQDHGEETLAIRHGDDLWNVTSVSENLLCMLSQVQLDRFPCSAPSRASRFILFAMPFFDQIVLGSRARSGDRNRELPFSDRDGRSILQLTP